MLRFYRNDGKCLNPVNKDIKGSIRTKREENPKEEEIKEAPVIKRGRKMKEVK